MKISEVDVDYIREYDWGKFKQRWGKCANKTQTTQGEERKDTPDYIGDIMGVKTGTTQGDIMENTTDNFGDRTKEDSANHAEYDEKNV